MRSPALLLWLVLALACRGMVQAADVPWSLHRPERPARPVVNTPAWCRSELDFFTLSAMERAGLMPELEAERAVWLRRVSLDLTGLPPSLAEYEQFAVDPSPEAYERTADRLMSSPHFGERWAAMWLDLARFADTQGYEKDNLRTIWAYRDWVIDAFNRDQPFDQFTVEQLAGDLLPAPTTDQLIATAFHRNTMTNTEGGTDDEEFRLKAVLDRARTTATVWLGLTVGCAQCHDHPTDPLTQTDFFALAAFFNNTADTNAKDDAPMISVVPLAARGSASPAETLVPIMRELNGAQRRVMYRWQRGDWLQPREVIEPGVPSSLPPLPPSVTRDRMALAHWLTSAENSLTARVMVNRVWAQLFGRGLVETLDNFGASGARPSHPELLDLLSVAYREEYGWSLKRLLREIVLSATYRERCETSQTKQAADPENRWLARGARFRLPAEMVRDQALALAGLLCPKRYGRGVMPPQPEGVWSVVYNVQRWVPSRGEDAYRRALYTFWRRTSPYPSAALFDAPSRENCTAQRNRTNSPAAALVMLNDTTFGEAAAALGRRLSVEGGATDEDRLRYGWRLCFGVPPTEQTLAALRPLLAQGAEKWNAVGAALLNLDQTLTRE